MRSTAVRNNVKRTASGTSFSGEESDGLLPRSSSSSRRGGGRSSSYKERFRPRLSKAAQQASAPFESNTLLWTFLIMGLLFCIIDTVYMVHYMTRHESSDAHSSPSGQALEGKVSVISSSLHNDISELKRKPHAKIKITNPDVARVLAEIEADPDKQPILQLLIDADVDFNDIDADKLAQLPKWSDVTSLYGSEPVYVGLETCQPFQANTKIDPVEHFVSVAGSFNTGTNLMSELLISNCRMKERVTRYGLSQKGVRWQVLWGKHTPVFNETFRQGHRTYKDDFLTADAMFPAVTVRDPLKWAQSMCRHQYGAEWPHDKSKHCPNLVPNDVDLHLMKHKNVTVSATGAVPVQVTYAEFNVHHDSLIGFWNDWYNEYVNVKWPRLLVRFEDLVFFPQQVTKTVCECAGGELNPGRPFKFIVNSAKRGDAAHGKMSERTTYIDALMKYGTEKGRYKGFTRDDLDYLRKHLDPKLMQLFRYKYPGGDISAQALVDG